MSHKHLLAIGLILVVATGAMLPAYAGEDHDHASHGAAEEEVSRGPHGGRLLGDEDFALEITIYETGVPPEFRVYPFENGRPVDPTEVALSIGLHRFGGRVDEIGFRKRETYLVGDREVEEPHSFVVDLKATRAGEDHRWRYESWEGRTEISPEAAEASGIAIETAGAATIRTTLRLHGRIVPNDERLARVAPRYAGIVQEAKKRIGERVGKGDVLAVVESNESLRSYEIRSPIAGTVLERDLAPGEFVDGDHAIYTVGELSTVWLDLFVHPSEAGRLRTGQPVTVEVEVAEGDAAATAAGELVYLSPVGSERTQTIVVRAELPNADGRLRPGFFATARIVVEETEVAVAVRPEALQSFRDWDVVYLTDGKVFQAMPVEIGRRDSEWVEIRSGVEPGERYAARGSFVVKADVGKSGATHEH